VIEFHEPTHTYKIDGRPVPSVTQILKAMNCVNTRWYTDEGRERGKAIDTLTELHDGGELAIDAAEVYCPQYIGYAKAWIEFRKETGFVSASAQVIVGNATLGYAGTLDRRGSFLNLGLATVLLDIKTGAREWWHPLQTEGYRQCCTGVEVRGCVYLGRNGRFKWVEHDDPADPAGWLTYLNAYNYRKNKGAKDD
jgi:hypothetical protein